MSKRIKLYFTAVFGILLSLLLTWSLPLVLTDIAVLDYLLVYSFLTVLFLIASYIISDNTIWIKMLLSLVVLSSLFFFGALLFETDNQEASIAKMGRKSFVFWSFYELILLVFLFLTIRTAYRIFKKFQR